MFRKILFCLSVYLFSAPAYACSNPPGPQETENALRKMINNSDHVFIANVGRIIRRRWGPDDDMGTNLAWLLKRKNNGEVISDHQMNRLGFSDAVVQLINILPLKSKNLAEMRKRDQRYRLVRNSIKIDLLSPYSVAGHGPCYNFPRTCPWNIKPGEQIAVAVIEQKHEPWLATYCVRIEFAASQIASIVDRRASTSADKLIWPFIEEAKIRKRTREQK